MARPSHITQFSRRRGWRRAFVGLLGIIALSGLSAEGADDSGIARCQAIDSRADRTGLIFNPPGKQTYYERSRCFLRLAVETRDAELCTRVVERESWFFDGSGISPEACRKAVREQISEDRMEADSIEKVHRLASASLGPSSNRRDFTLRLVTAGSHPGTYRIDIELLSSHGQDGQPVESYLQPLGTSPARLARHVPRGKLVSSATAWPSEAPIQLQITLTLVPSSSDSQWVLGQVNQPLSSSRTVAVEPESRRDDSRGGMADA